MEIHRNQSPTYSEVTEKLLQSDLKVRKDLHDLTFFEVLSLDHAMTSGIVPHESCDTA